MTRSQDFHEVVYARALQEARSRKGQPLEPRDRELLERIKRKPHWRQEWIDTRAGAHHSPLATALRLAVAPDTALTKAIRYDSGEVFGCLTGMGIEPESEEHRESLLNQAMGGTGYFRRTIYPFSAWKIFPEMTPQQQLAHFEDILGRTAAAVIVEKGVVRKHPQERQQTEAQRRASFTVVASRLLPCLMPVAEKMNQQEAAKFLQIYMQMDRKDWLYETEALFSKVEEWDSAFARLVMAARVARCIEAANRGMAVNPG